MTASMGMFNLNGSMQAQTYTLGYSHITDRNFSCRSQILRVCLVGCGVGRLGALVQQHGLAWALVSSVI